MRHAALVLHGVRFAYRKTVPLYPNSPTADLCNRATSPSDGLYQPSERLTLKGDKGNQHLRNRSLSFVILDESRLYAADMIGADLRHASLFGAKMTSANLADADLTSASLFFANLTRANMTAANLTGTNLRSADRDHAKGLTQAQLVGACGTPMAIPSHPPSLILDRPCPPRPSKPVDPD